MKRILALLLVFIMLFGVLPRDLSMAEEPLLSSLTIFTSAPNPTENNTLLKGEESQIQAGVTFNPSVKSYELGSVPDTQSQLRFRTKLKEGLKAYLIYEGGEKDITHNGDTGSSWANLLSPGKNEFEIEVREGDVVKETYTFNLESIPELTDLRVTSYPLKEVFSGKLNNYSLSVPETLTEVEVLATPRKDHYQITINGREESTVPLDGVEKIDVQVRIEGVTNTYTIHVSKRAPKTMALDLTPSDMAFLVFDGGGHPVPVKNQEVMLLVGETYTYRASRAGYKSEVGELKVEGETFKLNLEKAPASTLKDLDAYWKNFRNSDVNMAITSAALPIGEDVPTLFAKTLGTGWSASPSAPIMVDGKLVVMAGNKIFKLDPDTGEILQEGMMTANPGFGITTLTYGEGMVFAGLSNGIIQAFNAETLESLWVYKDPLKGQPNSPITYKDGYIYTGFWNGEVKEANFVALTVDDEDPSQKEEEKTYAWNYTHKGGFYWAGSLVLGDVVVVGTDDGTGDYNGEAKLLLFNRYTGELLDEKTIIGDQRSSIAYDEDSQRIYFTTKVGYLYSASINEGKIENLQGEKYEAQMTGTPIVYKGKVYVGLGSGMQVGGTTGAVLVADANTLKEHYRKELRGYPQSSFLLSTAYEKRDGTIYLYTTYNTRPGGIQALKTTPDNTDASGAEIIDTYLAKGYEQYALASVMNGPDGTLYYKNDTANVLAVREDTKLTAIKSLVEIPSVEVYKKDDLMSLLPTSVTVVTEDDKEVVVPVTWEAFDLESKEVGTHILKGALELDGYYLSNPKELVPEILITVLEEEEEEEVLLKSFEELPLIEKEVGTAFLELSLPLEAKGILSNGESVNLAITWNEEGYDKTLVGKQELQGKVDVKDYLLAEGVEPIITQEIELLAKEVMIEDILYVKEASFMVGRDEESLELPREAHVLLSDNSYVKVPVTWSMEGLDLSKEGVYTLEGRMDLPEELKDMSYEPLSLTLRVYEEEVEEVLTITEVLKETLKADLLTPYKDLELPKVVTVTMSDKSTKNIPVKWINTYDEKKPGEQILKGELQVLKEENPLNLEAELVITLEEKELKITDLEAIKDQEYPFGTKKEDLKLPELIKVKLSNGKELNVPVTWDLTAFKEEAGTYTLEGTLELPEGVTMDEQLVPSIKVTVLDEEKELTLLERVYGSSRYETAVQISKSMHDKADVVVLTTGENFPDALTGSRFVKEKKASLLLVKKDEVPKDVLEEIKRLEVKEVIILGGEEAVSQSIEDSLTGYKVTRIHGKTRIETAVKLAKATGKTKEVFLVTAINFADAQSISRVSMEKDLPILLSYRDLLPSETKALLQEWGVEKVTLIGGESALSKKVEKDLQDLDILTSRLGGSTRFETSGLIHKHYPSKVKGLLLARGDLFSDALVGGPLAEYKGYSLMLTDRGHLSAPVEKVLKNEDFKEVLLIGGELALSRQVEDAVKALTK